MLPTHFTAVTQTWQSANTTAMYLPQSNKNLAFFNLITPLNIPYHNCLAPWGSQGQMRYQIFKLGDSWRDLSWQISQAILFRYSPSVLRGVWVYTCPGVGCHRETVTTDSWSLEKWSRGTYRVKASHYTAGETSSQGAATIEHILICHCILSLWL